MLAILADTPEFRVALVAVMVACAAPLVAIHVTHGNTRGCWALVAGLVLSVATYAACVCVSTGMRSCDVHLSDSCVSMGMPAVNVDKGVANVTLHDVALGDATVKATLGAWSSAPHDTFEVVVDDEKPESVLVFAKRADSRVAGQLSHSDYARHVVVRVASTSPLATYKSNVPSVDLGKVKSS